MTGHVERWRTGRNGTVGGILTANADHGRTRDARAKDDPVGSSTSVIDGD